MNDPALPPSGAERYALALEAINEAVYDYDATNGTIYYAPQLGAMLGLEYERLRTVEDWTSRIHPDDLPSYRQAWRALFRGEQARLDCQYRYRAGDGKWRWAHQHGIALRDGTGRVQRVVGATGDITELRDAQELQAATAEVLRAISRADFDLETVLQTLVRTVAQLTRAEAAILWRYRDGAYHYAAGHLLNPEFESIERATPIRPGEETVVGRAALRQSTVQIVDAWTDPDYGPKHEARLGGVRSMLAVPLVARGRADRHVQRRASRRRSVYPATDLSDRQLRRSGGDRDRKHPPHRRTAASAPPIWRKRSHIRARRAKFCASSTIRPPIRRPSSTPFSKRRRVFATPDAGLLWLYDGDVFRAAALRDLPPAYAEFVTRGPVRPGAETTLAQVIKDPRVRSRDDIRSAPPYHRARAAYRRARGAWRLPQHDRDPARQGRRGARRDVAVSAGGQAVFREAPRADGGLRDAGGHRARKRPAVRGKPAARRRT